MLMKQLLTTVLSSFNRSRAIFELADKLIIDLA
jgi:hypothetical protein